MPEVDPQGYLYFQRGKLIHGVIKKIEGVDACVRLLVTRKGTFSFTHGTSRCPETITETIGVSKRSGFWGGFAVVAEDERFPVHLIWRHVSNSIPLDLESRLMNSRTE